MYVQVIREGFAGFGQLAGGQHFPGEAAAECPAGNDLPPGGAPALHGRQSDQEEPHRRHRDLLGAPGPLQRLQRDRGHQGARTAVQVQLHGTG